MPPFKGPVSVTHALVTTIASQGGVGKWRKMKGDLTNVPAYPGMLRDTLQSFDGNFGGENVDMFEEGRVD